MVGVDRRTTAVLLGLVSLVTLLTHDVMQDVLQALAPRQTVCYPNSRPTFSHTLALVSRHLGSGSGRPCNR